MATANTGSSGVLKHLECPICLEKFKVPRSLPTCLHSFCHICLVVYIKNDVKKNHSHQCPVCRDYLSIKGQPTYDHIEAWVSQLPLNHMIVSLLDEVTEEESQTRDEMPSHVCASHHGKQLEYMCKDHNQLLCDSCVAKSHRKCDNVKDIATVLEDMADFSNQNKLKGRIDNVRASLGDTVDRVRNDVTTIENDEKNVKGQISGFKNKIQMLVSLAKTFEEEIMGVSKNTFTQLIDEKQIDLGIGLNRLMSLEESEKKCASSSSSPIDLLKSHQSLADVLTECESFVKSQTDDPKKILSKKVLSLDINSALDNLLNHGFGKLQSVDATMCDLEPLGATALEPKPEPCTITPGYIPVKHITSQKPPVAGISKPTVTDRVETVHEKQLLSLDINSALEYLLNDCDETVHVHKCSDSVYWTGVHVAVPSGKVPRYTGAAYLPDERLVLVDNFHKRLVLLDPKFRFHSFLVLAPQKPEMVVYIGSNELAVSVLEDNDSLDKFVIVKVRGKQLVVQNSVDIPHFAMEGIALLNQDQLLVSTCNSRGNYALSEMSISNGRIGHKRIFDDGYKINCINGFTVDTECHPGERCPRVYIYRGCDECSHYRLICTNMDGAKFWVYEDEDLVPNSNSALAVCKSSGRVLLCNKDNIHVIGKGGKKRGVISGDCDDILAMAVNEKGTAVIVTHHAWDDRKIIHKLI